MVAQVLEEALALLVIIILEAVLKGFEGLTLGAVELFRDLHLDDHILVAAAAPVQVLDALAPQAELGAALGAFGYALGHLAVHGGDLDLGPSTAWE